MGLRRKKGPGAAQNDRRLSEGLGEVIGGGMAASRNFFLKKSFEIYGSKFIRRLGSEGRGD